MVESIQQPGVEVKLRVTLGRKLFALGAGSARDLTLGSPCAAQHCSRPRVLLDGLHSKADWLPPHAGAHASQAAPPPAGSTCGAPAARQQQ
jgi:hypothetical protein